MVGAAALTGGMAVALGAVRYFGGDPHLEQGAEGLLAAIAFAALVAAPAMLCILSRRGRPALLAPAGVGAILLSTIAMSGAMVVLLVPGILALVVYRRRAAEAGAARAPAGVVTLVVTAGVIGAVAVLFLLHQDPRSYRTATGGGATGDVVTWWESMASVAVLATAIRAGWCLAGPGPATPARRTRTGPPGGLQPRAVTGPYGLEEGSG